MILLVLLCASQYFRVREVNIEGESALAREKLSLLSGRSIFSSAISQTAKELASQDLTISRVDCRRGLPSVLKCQINLRQAVFSYQQAGKTFLVDEQGLLFAEAPVQSGAVIIVDTTTTGAKVAAQPLSHELIKTYQTIVGRLSEQGYQAKELRLGDTLYQVEVVTARPDREQLLIVKFNLVESLNQQLEIMVSTLKQRSSEINDYLDLRVAGVVYFK